ncbi:hypothetical protein [Flavobacterium sp. WC2509]|uniref:hypothetical protein n=1 Tax=Flavobacterium sp. WC2509 TaxID=3461406 RepID=UPI004043B462
MKKETFLQKVNRRAWFELQSRLKGKVNLLIYGSYWNYWINGSKSRAVNTSSYYAARPNLGAGIGHQMANWIAGYWYAKQFGLQFAHMPFSNQKWDDFLGFGEGEPKITDLVAKGYKKVKLPLFNEFNEAEVNLQKKIIASYSNQKVVFVAEQDQGYKDQYGVIDSIKDKFNNSPARLGEKIIYESSRFNIAVHVRRTVIIDNKVILEDEAARAMRWLSNDYYEKVLKQVVENLSIAKPISVYIFSTGKPDEFAEFAKYGDVHFCSDMDEYATFLHLIRADLLITSKSSFSYKPALINNAIKVCPRNFWHSYPKSKDWILVENDGSFDVNKLMF